MLALLATKSCRSFPRTTLTLITRRFFPLALVWCSSCFYPRMVSVSAFSTSTATTTTSKPESYTPPVWTENYLTHVPTSGRLRLAHIPTPVQTIRVMDVRATTKEEEQHPLLQLLRNNIPSFTIKRDDLTGSAVETGGNKIRKLEFLLADAHACTAVVTIGGAQSNHCRSTAAACRLVGGLEPHLILRTRRKGESGDDDDDDIGYTGNLLMDRMMGSTLYTCTPGEYGRLGSQALVERVCHHLRSSTNHRPYAIPVGGSNALGTWGYIEAVDELMAQQAAQQPPPDHIVFACGSGGTAAGIAIGVALYHHHHGTTPPTLHAMGVCDTPDYFYQHMASIATAMGLQVPNNNDNTASSSVEAFLRKHIIVHSSKGKGYAVSTKEELEFIAAFSRATGIVLDPVYTGKALYSFLQDVVQPNPDAYQNVLFWHTGGALGMYDKCDDMSSTVTDMLQSPCHRLDVYGTKGGSHDGSSIDISKDVAASSSSGPKKSPDSV